MRYGTIGTSEKYFLKWKEDQADNTRFKLDKYLLKMCGKERLIELLHDFVLFDGGVKKLPRVHQYVGVNKAQERVNAYHGSIIWAALDIVMKYVGPSASNIVCLNPLGADTVPSTVQGGPFACLAIVNEALPRRLSLDWSYDGAFGIAEELHGENAQRPARSIFVGSAKRWGSIVAYDAIHKGALRAYCQGCMPHDPSRWPMLTTVADGILQVF